MPGPLKGAASDSLTREVTRLLDPELAPLPLSDNSYADSLVNDSLIVFPADTIPFVDDLTHSSLQEAVTGKVQDSLVYEVTNDQLFFYKDATINYQDMSIDAQYMHFDMTTKNVFARGTVDLMATPPRYTQPVFKQNQTEYELDSIKYNIDTEMAIIRGIKTQEGEGFLSGGTVKKMPDNVMHLKGGRYTTCDADPPHFHLQMTKGSVVPNKKVVFGPAYLNFEGVPFYILGVPFGFFPQKSERNSGFIIPEIGEEVQKGFFLREGGYYFVFNDYVDLRLTGGIYTKGSWETHLATNYTKRYKFRGNFSFDYANDVIGQQGSADYMRSNNMQVRWSHSQDPKFRPNSTFSASVNYASKNYNKYNATDLNDYLQTSTSSSVSYSKTFAGKPFSLALSANHSQNLQSGAMMLTLPTMSFNVNRINPFRRKEAIGKERWYEKLAFTYNMDLSNTSHFQEEDFMKQGMLENMRSGIQHRIPVSMSFNLLKYMNFTPGVNYTERWYFRKVYRDWNPATEQIEPSDTTHGFYRVFNYSFGVGTNTKLYGEYTMGRDEAKAIRIRHVFTPNVSFSFSPDFGSDKYGYYETVQYDKAGNTMRYSPFADVAAETYGLPGTGRSMALGFGVGNTLEMKAPSEKDTSGVRKIKLIEAFNIGSSYNFVADSLRLAPFSANFRTTLFKGVNLDLTATFDPYQVNANGRKIDKFMTEQGKLVRMTSLSFGFNYSFSSAVKKDSKTAASNNPNNNSNAQVQNAVNDPSARGFFDPNKNDQASAIAAAQLLASQYYDFDIPWSVGFGYSFRYSRPGNTTELMQTANFNGSVTLTKKWAVEFGGGYDFEQKKLTPGAIMIRRDLHDFQATLSWVPIGFRQSWSFSIRAKSSMLSDVLKYEKSNSFLDNYYGQ